MDWSTLPEIGIGGIFALLVIREVLNFINRRGGKDSVSQAEFDENKRAVTAHEFETHKSMVQYKDNCQEVVKRFDCILASQDKRFDRIDTQFSEVKDLIKLK